MTKTELSKTIQKAAIDKGIAGVMELVEKSGITYARASKAWRGDMSITVIDLNAVCNTLGLDINLIARAE